MKKLFIDKGIKVRNMDKRLEMIEEYMKDIKYSYIDLNDNRHEESLNCSRIYEDKTLTI